MSNPESLMDYIKCKSNTAMLKSFAIKKLCTNTIKEDFVLDCFEMYIDSIRDSEVEKVQHWSPTNENIAQININIWTHLKEKILHVIESRSIDPEEKIKQLFDDSMTRPKRSEQFESKTMERHYSSSTE